MISKNKEGNFVYHGDTFQIIMHRYSDPKRLNMARNAAIYLGKSDRDNIKRPLSIIRQGHVNMVARGECAEFEFVDVDKPTYDHIITYTTQNMRVAGGNRALTSDDFTVPSDKIKNPDLVKEKIQSSMNNYKDLLEAGETPQVSRAAMAVSAKLNPFVYQFNFVTLGESLFKQRIWESGAQGNTVKVVKGMWELVHSIDPEFWDTVYEWYGKPATDWVEVRRKLKKKNITVGNITRSIITNTKEEKTFLDMPLEEYLVMVYGEQKSMW